MRIYPIVITNGIFSDTLFFGLDVNATNGIDQPLGEFELPPAPPTEIFDVRFIGDGLNPPVAIGQGLKKDFRPSDTVNIVDTIHHRIKYQLGTGTSLTFIWSNIDVRINMNLQDVFGGVLLNQNLSGSGTFVLPANLNGLTQLNFNVVYDFVLPVELTAFVSTTFGNSVRLKWTTQSELNNTGFDVERKKSIESSWIRAGFVEGIGTSTQSNEYEFTDRNLQSGSYNYRLKQTDVNGNYEYHYLSEAIQINLPESFDLTQNYPNPFNPSTMINYNLPYDGKTVLRIFDQSGKEIRTIVNEFQTAGYYSVNFNAGNLSSGIYFYTLTSGDLVITKKMTLIK